MKLLPWVFCGLVVGSAWLAVFFAGSIVVHDRTGQVVRAAAVNERQAQGLYRLPGGVFVGVPKLTGEVEITCWDGARRRGLYVTEHLHSRGRTQGAGCPALESGRNGLVSGIVAFYLVLGLAFATASWLAGRLSRRASGRTRTVVAVVSVLSPVLVALGAWVALGFISGLSPLTDPKVAVLLMAVAPLVLPAILGAATGGRWFSSRPAGAA